MEINKKQFNRWLKALYEQEFPQTTGSLQDGDGYCCLGVGCKILIPEEKQELINGTTFLRGGLPGSQSNSPQWLKNINNDFKEKSGEPLDWLNDSGYNGIERFTHSEIAMLLDLVYNYKILENEN